jgi:phosphopantetheinyl transferase (holo-ACP synthase)
VIVGLGLDIAEVDRIAAAIERRGAPILERLYTPREVLYCERHSSVPTLVEQKELVIGSEVIFTHRDLCK